MLTACLVVVLVLSIGGVAELIVWVDNGNRHPYLATLIFFAYLFVMVGTIEAIGRLNGVDNRPSARNRVLSQ